MAEDKHTEISTAVMKGSDGGFLFDGEFIQCSGGKDIALVHEDWRKLQRSIFNTMTRTYDRKIRQLSRSSGKVGAFAGNNRTLP